MSYQDQTTVNQGTGIDEKLLTQPLYDAALQESGIGRFVQAIREAGLQDTLRTPDFKTLLAPADEALGDSLPGEPAELRKLVSRHIIVGSQTEADIRTADALRPLEGEPVRVEFRDGRALIEGAQIIRSVPCNNGHLHIIDKVLKP